MILGFIAFTRLNNEAEIRVLNDEILDYCRLMCIKFPIYFNYLHSIEGILITCLIMLSTYLLNYVLRIDS